MKNTKWSLYNSIEDFNNFIKLNNVQSRKDLRIRFNGLYNRAYKIKRFSKELIYPIEHNNWDSINSLEDVLNFIKLNSITKELFIKNYNGLYQRCTLRLKLSINDIYPENILEYNWSNINTLNDFQQIVDEYRFINPTLFYKTLKGLYRKAVKLNYIRKLKFYQKRNMSIGENQIKMILEETFNLIEDVDFIYDRTFALLLNKDRYDFRLDKYNLIIEYNGILHYQDTDWTTFEASYSKDKIKFENCKNLGYTIIYVSFVDLDYRFKNIDFENLNYFNDIYINKLNLINKLKTIIK